MSKNAESKPSSDDHEKPDGPASKPEAADSSPGAEDGPPSSKHGEESSALSSAKEWLLNGYATLDRRTLGLFRIYFGCLLFWDVSRRFADATRFFSNSGVLANHFNLYAPMGPPAHTFSLLNACSSPLEVKVAFLIIMVIYAMYIVGYRTRVAQVLALVAYTSCNNRNLFLENGGCVVVAILCGFSLFMPIGERFSVDAVLASLRRRREHKLSALNDRMGDVAAGLEPLHPKNHSFRSIVAVGLVLQIAAVYLFNVVTKSGTTWKDGSAVHWVLWQNRVATPIAALIREHEPAWFSMLATKGALVMESALFITAINPLKRSWSRTAVFVLAVMLHGGIAATMNLGPFSFAMMALTMLLVSTPTIEGLAKLWKKRGESLTLYADPKDAGVFWACRVLARLDPFHKLTFVDLSQKDKLPEALADREKLPPVVALDEAGERHEDQAALSLAMKHLPLGPLWAPLASLPVGMLFERREMLAKHYNLDAGLSHDSLDQDVTWDTKSTFAQGLDGYLAYFREGFGLIFVAAILIEISVSNGHVPRKFRYYKAPTVIKDLVRAPRMLQGWRMFAPEAPKRDGRLVIDGTTVDGRSIDPFTGEKPDFEPYLHGPWGMSQFECDYHLKITFRNRAGYRKGLRRYLKNWHRLEGRSNKDRLRKFVVYWVENDAPPPGSTTPSNPKKTVILTGP